MDQENRVVVLIDMDCFYCQVEEKLNPELKGKPIAVVQYNPWQGGGIIAVNYVARALGVTRHMRGKEAKEKCPEIQLPSVPCQRGKADITKYRDAGKEVAKILQKFTPLLERASIDEAYLDITDPVHQRLNSLSANTIKADMIPNTYALGYDSVEEFLADIQTCGGDAIDFDYNHVSRLLIGSVIVSEIRAAVYKETGYSCSAGIAHNKILAKLVCGMNKPNKQTILPKHCVDILYKTLPLKKVKHLGGKFGSIVCETLKINTMGELQKFSENKLQSTFDEKNGSWLYNIAHGTDLEPVQARFNPKSIGCCKNFKGKSALQTLDTLKKWLKDLGDEIEDRLENDSLENNRTPKQMVVSYTTQLPDKKDVSSSRSYNFLADEELCGELFSTKALELILDNSEGCKVKGGESDRKLKAPITFLGISVGKFEDHSDSKKTKKIFDYFAVGISKDMENCNTKIKDKQETTKENLKSNEITLNKNNAKSVNKEYILQKFFETCNKDQDESKETRNITNNTEAVLESSLSKQESFFEKMLNTNLKGKNISNPGYSDTVDDVKVKPTTSMSDVTKCEENSNDTDYSGSTINNEINRSIALFEDDPQDVARVTNIRQLLKPRADTKNDNDIEVSDHVTALDQMIKNNKVETFDCSQCGKTLTFDMVEMHSDYHLALKLRDEERQLARDEKQKNIVDTPKENKRKRNTAEDNSYKSETSIAHFFVKIDESIVTETCSECSKKVPTQKFAEHLDFHEAQKLSRELNRKSSPLVTGNSVKRKKKPLSPLKALKVPCKSIDSFFR